jgi:tetratricopeptide (TPR) repeat protein
MTPDRFQELRGLFERVLDAPEPDRASMVEDVARTDDAMAEELRRMLDAHAQRTSLLDGAALAALHAASRSLPEGYPVGAYRIEKRLDTGGMGVVYLATRSDGSFERKAAIKVMRGDRIDPQFLNRFYRERKILAQLDHPHIASILDAGETSDGDPYFVMEYVDGMTITEFCRRHALSEDRRLELFLQVCDALRHAHRRLTVHRDLKPDNVLVTAAGAVKLLDFGIAKLIESPDGEAEMASALILTPEYSSPEQIEGGPVTTATDVFALGILLYELISGKHPFRQRGQQSHEVMRAICEDDPPHLAGELYAIAATALRKRAEWRYPSVEQLADDVRNYRRGWPVSAKGDGRAYRLKKFARRQWMPLTAAALVMLSLAAGMIAADIQAKHAEQARAVAEQERANSDRQRQIAEQARREAMAQHDIAEARTREAELAQKIDRQRYQDIRSLASSLLFDLNDGIRDLAGSTTARRLIIAKVQRQLEVLNADGGHDPGLQRDLAACYERMGELQVDPARPDKNDAATALGSYRKAVLLRRNIAQSAGASAQDRADLAMSIARLGEGELRAGDAQHAAASLNSAREIAKTASSARTIGLIDERRCTILFGAGDSQGATDACQEGISILQPIAAAAPNDVQVQRSLARMEGAYGNALRMSQKPKEAEPHVRAALQSLAHLEQLAPNNAEYRRMASAAESVLAMTMASAGDLAGSLDAYHRSAQAMRVALEIEPGDLNSALRLGVTLFSFSGKLATAGNQAGARDAAVQALELFQETAEKPAAGVVEWNEYANALLKVQWPDLRQASKALELAQKAVSATSRKNPFVLDTLAWAYYRSGDRSRALETEREAMRLLPANAKGGLHDELEASLKTFLGGI